ncbi:predicted protein [Naegleria gruberi]|uniref:RNA methyltransferase n=1 Tax=Naegleria gruberi TaxID=5762 RepID=D2V086_NAEGR|nr:uncharacterized protein NAEGRDRAFT_45643 [Naegleria gruberi]EFC49482.1 predicted protein [Naegleria gruberi]|eukprot:XP_002682226.1 predicted protein [Naegleria gruberi strain NEG-M]
MKRKYEEDLPQEQHDEEVSVLATQEEEGVISLQTQSLESTSEEFPIVATQEFEQSAQQQSLNTQDSSSQVGDVISGLQTQSEVVEKTSKKWKFENNSTSKDSSFGNYKNYYSYRYNDVNAAKPKEDRHLIDPRLEIISNCLTNYFKNSTESPINLNCLDIGCNQGLFSMQMADFYESQLGVKAEKEISLKNMNAIDIDSVLIRKAKDHLINLKRFNATEKDQDEDDKLGMSVHTYVALHRAETPEEKEEKIFIWRNNRKLLKEHLDNSVNICHKSYMNTLIDKVHFKVQNFVEEIVETKISDLTIEKMQEIISKSTNKTQATFNIISCLSVTKWVHLNYGDNSVKFLFHKIHKLLKPGGIFILEPQHWKSYTKKRELNSKIQENFKHIKFRPTSFHDYLLKEVGFTSSETFFIDENSTETPTGNKENEKKKKKGFKKRPIVFYYR